MRLRKRRAHTGSIVVSKFVIARPWRSWSPVSIWWTRMSRDQPCSMVARAYQSLCPSSRTLSKRVTFWCQGNCATTCCTICRSARSGRISVYILGSWGREASYVWELRDTPACLGKSPTEVAAGSQACRSTPPRWPGRASPEQVGSSDVAAGSEPSRWEESARTDRRHYPGAKFERRQQPQTLPAATCVVDAIGLIGRAIAKIPLMPSPNRAMASRWSRNSLYGK